MKNLERVLNEIYGDDFSGENDNIEPNVIVFNENGIIVLGTAFQLMRMCGPIIKELNVLELMNSIDNMIFVKVEKK